MARGYPSLLLRVLVITISVNLTCQQETDGTKSTSEPGVSTNVAGQKGRFITTVEPETPATGPDEGLDSRARAERQTIGPVISSASTTTYRAFETITLHCHTAFKEHTNVTWNFRHYNSTFVTVYGYDLSLAVSFYTRFRNRYVIKERIDHGQLTSDIEITMALPGDRGWYSCMDTDHNSNSTVFVEFLYDNCGENGVYYEEFGCIEFLEEDECMAKAGVLATIHDWRKNAWIYDLAFHVEKARGDFKLGLTLLDNTMLWRDFVWTDGSSLSYTEWFGGQISCPRCLERSAPMAIGMTFHMDSSAVWEWTDVMYTACEWPRKSNITGMSVGPSNVSFDGTKQLYRCRTSGEYISTSFVCDHSRDCNDASDENDCGNECEGTSFTCNCGGCVSASNVCDFYKDCTDGSDEEFCDHRPCDDGYWQCDNMECVPVYNVCDGELECADGSDEADRLCKGTSHSPTDYSIRCVDPSSTVPSSRHCDGIRDCLGLSDEQSDTCYVPFYSCGGFIGEIGGNKSRLAVNLGLIQYGTTIVDCFAIGTTSAMTAWPFEEPLASRTLATYSGTPLTTTAVWTGVPRRANSSLKLDYVHSITQKRLIAVSTSCVQYIRACGDVMGSNPGNVVLEWRTNQSNSHVFTMTVNATGCSGYCMTTGCKVNPAIVGPQYPQSVGAEEKHNWMPITNKDQLPIVRIKTSHIVILGISPMECTEEREDVDPRYLYTEGIMWCKTGVPYYPHQRCLMDFDPTGEPMPCRDLTHLEDCEDFTCPVDYVKCPGAYCLHLRFICDGRNHCPRQEDELDCETHECSGYYRCRKSKRCIPFGQLCDGVRHCPMGDDEQHCSPHCPRMCECHGLTFRCVSGQDIISLSQIDVETRWIDLKTNMSDMTQQAPVSLPYLTTLVLHECSIQDLFVADQSIFQNITALKHLDLSSNLIQQLSGKPFHGFRNLQTLILKNNPLEYIGNLVFPELTTLKYLEISHTKIKQLVFSDSPNQSIFHELVTLEHLDLSSNMIEVLPGHVFDTLLTLTYLTLDNNPLIYVDTLSFQGMYSLKELKLSYTELTELRQGMFDDLTSLTELNLSSGAITDIEYGTFHTVEHLKTLDIQQNRLEIHEFMFKGLSKLEYLYTDSYKTCCIRPISVAKENCFAPEESISSCSNLIGLDILRIFLWLLGIAAVIGNITVVIYRVLIDKANLKKSYSLFVINLGISDFIMGVYMLTIAAVDMHYSGVYVAHDKDWRKSILCATAGILSTISSEMSTFVILMITIDRFIVILFPLSLRKFSWKNAVFISIVLWIVAIIIAVVPQVFFQSYFKGMFYSRSAVCLALPLTGQYSPGGEYSAAIFIVLNSTIFLVIVIAQICIYRKCKESGSVLKMQNRKKEIAVARSLFLVVATDFCCWFPIGIIGVWSQTGGSVGPEVYAWVMVFLLPINSAINPLLYTYTYVRRKRLTYSLAKRTGSGLSTEMSSLRPYKGKPVLPDASMRTNMVKEIYFSELLKRKDEDTCLERYISSHSLSPYQAFRIARGTIDSLAFLHERNVLHGNVSTQRVYIDMNKGVVRRAALVLEEMPMLHGDTGTHVDMLQFGHFVKTLLRKLDRR